MMCSRRVRRRGDRSLARAPPRPPATPSPAQEVIPVERSQRSGSAAITVAGPRHVAERAFADEVSRAQFRQGNTATGTPRASRPRSGRSDRPARLPRSPSHPPRPRRGSDAWRDALQVRGPQRAESEGTSEQRDVRRGRPPVAVVIDRPDPPHGGATPPPATRVRRARKAASTPMRCDEAIGAITEPRASAAIDNPSCTPNTRARTSSSTLRWSSVRDVTSKKLFPIPASPNRTSADAGPLVNATKRWEARWRTRRGRSAARAAPGRSR